MMDQSIIDFEKIRIKDTLTLKNDSVKLYP